MTTIWPILLIITTLSPLLYKLWHKGEPVNLSREQLKGGFGRTCLATILNFALLYLCGFFLAFGWPQIVWIILTAFGFFTTTAFLIATWAFPQILETLQNHVDKNKTTLGMDFFDIFTYGLIFIVYVCGGAFAAW